MIDFINIFHGKVIVLRFFMILFIVFVTFPTWYIYSQWSTSTKTDSALWIGTGGFNTSAVTYDDGSIIICSGPWSTINLLKLDPRGYRVWPNIVTAHYNDSTDNEGGVGESIISDGSGGVIFMWADHRGAYRDSVEGQYFSEAYYIQRVDSNSIVRWGPGGVLVASPTTGMKMGSLTTDGAGGTIVSWVEYGVNIPDANGLSDLRAARYNTDGQKLWEVTLDSMYDTLYWARRITFQNIVRAGRYVYVDYLKWPLSSSEIYLTRIIDTSGVAPPESVWYGYLANVSWRDSILFNFGEGNRLRKISANGMELWDTIFIRPSGCQGGWIFWYNPLVPDEQGGVYVMYVCNDSVYYFSNSGEYKTVYCSNLLSFDSVVGSSSYAFSDECGGIVVANTEGITQRYDSLGIPLWGESPITYLSDPQNAYYEGFHSDNNGGIIITYWSWGIYAMHTGRYGKVGVVPVREEPILLPQKFELRQNFPNPFNASTTIKFSLGQKSKVKIAINDILGRCVSTLIEDELQAGVYAIDFDGTNCATGVYIVRMETEKSSLHIRKMILMK